MNSVSWALELKLATTGVDYHRSAYAGVVIKDTIAGTRKSVVLSQQLAGSRSICEFIHKRETRRDNVV